MADEILKAKLQQIDANDTQIGSNDAQIGTNDLEIKGQVNALRQYGIGVTGIHRDRLGDVVYDLADGFGQGGGGGDGLSRHEIDFTLTSPLSYYALGNTYFDIVHWFYYYPTDAANQSTNTIAVGSPYIEELPISATGVQLLKPSQFYVNDSSYNTLRIRGNINSIPTGTYKLVWYGNDLKKPIP